MNILIPMAGLGSRFNSQSNGVPKPLLTVNDKSFIQHSIESFDVDGRFIFVTRTFDNTAHNTELSELLKKLRPESIEIKIEQVTSGAAATCLHAKELINNDDPLVIYNCDQIIKWEPRDFLNFVNGLSCAGSIVTYTSTDPKNSFACVENGRVTKIVEKNPISDVALVGFHWWKKGSDFVQSAENLCSSLEDNRECFISETYNYLINNNSTILSYHIPTRSYISLGTPKDVSNYLALLNEYTGSKPKTILCDIDGTIFQHCHSSSEVLLSEPVLLENVREKFNEWDMKGNRIILITGRKESLRPITEQQLCNLGLVYDQLIMGVSNGPRYLINDKLTATDSDRACAINIITDSGFGSVDWKEHGL